MRVSAIVLTYNSQRYAESCLRSLVEVLSDSDEENEILIVDNGSQDESPEIARRLADEFPMIRPTFLEQNRGTTYSRNLAARQAKGRFLLITDSDVKHVPGTVERLIEHIESDPKCGIAAPRLIYPDGRHQISTDVFPTIGVKVRRVLRLKAMERDTTGAALPQQPVDVDYAISAFWLMRREVYDAVGPLDEKIFFAPEDVDYSIRVWQTGYKMVYVPMVHAIHDAQETTRRSPFSRDVLNHLKGLFYLFRKHRYAFSHKRLYRRVGRHTNAGTKRQRVGP